MNPTDPLAQLRDIHAPAEISAWPPGPGWWLLLILVLALVLTLAWWLRRAWREGAWRRQALKELDQAHRDWETSGNTSEFMYSLSAILKRAAMHQAPGNGVARLNGDDWDHFLDSRWRQPPERGFSALQFADRVHRPQSGNGAIDELHSLGQNWLRQQRRQAW